MSLMSFNPQFFARSVGGKKGELYIYQDIGDEAYGGVSARSVRDELKKVGDVAEMDIFINSPGGEVFEGFAIYNQLMRHPAKKTVFVDGIAASTASVIMLAGDRRVVAENADVMIHDPWGMGYGNARDMLKVADTLDKVRDNILETYVSRTGYDRKKLSDMMAKETWFNAQEALSYGFATEVGLSSTAFAAFTMIKKFKNAPQKYSGVALSHKTRLAEMSMAASAVVRSRASSEPKT